MADDQIWNYVEDYIAGSITKSAFWELAKFKYPTHQMVFGTEAALRTLHYDILAVDKELVRSVPGAAQMGKVYQRLIVDTLQPGEDFVQGIIRVYNNDICDVIDNYNCSAYYEPSYVIARAYQEGGF